jgi:hypothetical protein
LPLDGRGKLFYLRTVHRTFSARNGQRAFQLLSVERLAFAFAFDHNQLTQLNALKGCKAPTATLALPPTADRAIVFGRTAVLYLTIVMSAKWAAQLFFLILFLVHMPVRDDACTNQCTGGKSDWSDNACGCANGCAASDFFNCVLIGEMLAGVKSVLGRAPQFVRSFTDIMLGLVGEAFGRKLLRRFGATLRAELHPFAIFSITLVTKSHGYFPSVY